MFQRSRLRGLDTRDEAGHDFQAVGHDHGDCKPERLIDAVNASLTNDLDDRIIIGFARVTKLEDATLITNVLRTSMR